MPAIDTVAGGVSAGIGLTAAIATATGDSLGVRNFPSTSKAYLENTSFQGAVQANIASYRVRSPRFHDNVSGITVTPGELLVPFGLPPIGRQALYPADVLVAEITGGAAAEFQEMALFVYYEQLEGSDAKLIGPGDLAGNVQSLKSFRTVIGAVAANTWSDTAITTTDNQLHADSRYALLGYATNTPMTAVGVKGQDTGNLRACGPGSVAEQVTAQYFVDMSIATGAPHIPVVQANNRAGISVSAISRAAIAGTEQVTLHLAELAG